MAAFLNFGGACTYKLKNTKTMRDKLNLINDIPSQFNFEFTLNLFNRILYPSGHTL